MLRKTYTFVCALFALMFAFGLQSRSNATVVNASGGFMGPDRYGVSFLVRGTDVTQLGQVSLTTRTAHYYANVYSLGIASTSVAFSAIVTDLGSTTYITGTLTRPNTNSTWTVNCAVYVNGSLVNTYSAPFLGQVAIN